MGVSKLAVANMGSAQPPQISIRQNRFWLVGEDGVAVPVPPMPEGYALDVVVAAANPGTTRVCYLNDYDPKAIDHPPPDCWSNDGITPDASVTNPQNDKCLTCQWNKWGSETSKATGKGVKKCKEGKSLAVVIASDIPEHGQAYRLRITPGARKLWQKYNEELTKKKVGDIEVDVSHVITRLSFDPQVQGVLNFKAVGWVHDTDIALANMYEEHAFTALIGVEPPPEHIATPLTPALVHQSAPAKEAPIKSVMPPKSEKKYELPFDDEIPF